MKKIKYVFTLIVVLQTQYSDAQTPASDSTRYFDTLSNLLNEPCVAYGDDHYAASFQLNQSESSNTLAVSAADLLSSLADIPQLAVNPYFKDCTAITVDWKNQAVYRPSKLSLTQGDTDLQSSYDIEAFASLNSEDVSFEIKSACLSDDSTDDYWRCAKRNIPTLTPEIYLLIGDSPKIPEEYESDYRQLLNWLVDMGLGYDRYVHIVYELDGDNEESLRTLAQLGYTLSSCCGEGAPVSEIEHVHDQRSCLSGLWAYGAHGGKRQYNFCIQPNPLTDPVWEFDRSINPDQYWYNVLHGQIHEYFHHYQRAHTLDRDMGMSGDCCGLRNPVEVPPFWSEGAAIVFPDMFLWEKFYELDYTKRNNFKRGDAECGTGTALCHGLSHDGSSAPMVCQGFDTYLCDKLVGVYKNVKQGIQENGGQCYLGSRDGVGLDGVVRQPQCDWAMSAYYLAYYASHQIMWVDIPRDMWAMGFPAAFQTHVGLTVDEFAESFSNFMNSGSPDDPPPEGFFTEKPLSELVDFWSLKTNPSGIAQ